MECQWIVTDRCSQCAHFTARIGHVHTADEKAALEHCQNIHLSNVRAYRTLQARLATLSEQSTVVDATETCLMISADGLDQAKTRWPRNLSSSKSLDKLCGHRSTWLATSATALLVWLNIQVNAPCLWFLGMFSGYWDPTPKYLSWNQTSFVLRFVKDSSWFLLMFPMTRVVRSLWLRPFWIGPMISFDLASAPCPQTWSWRLGSGPTLDLWGGGGQKKSYFFILSCSSWSLSIPGLWRSG